MTTKEISLEQFLSMTDLATLIPDWDAYEYGGNLFLDKENLIKMIYSVVIREGNRHTIQLREYDFIPFNVTLAEIKQMIESNKTIDVLHMAGHLILRHRLASWHQVWNYENYQLDILNTIKQILSGSTPGSDEEAQYLLDEWCKRIAPAGGAMAGDFFPTGKMFEIESIILLLGE